MGAPRTIPADRALMSEAPLQHRSLRDERGGSWRRRSFPAPGCSARSLRHRGDELLAQNAGVDAYAERGKTMGIPLLYPWANRLAGFRLQRRPGGRSRSRTTPPASRSTTTACRSTA